MINLQPPNPNTPPNPLPLTLPVGTRTRVASGLYVATAEARLTSVCAEGGIYRAQWERTLCGVTSSYAYFTSEAIDWSSVPVQPTNPVFKVDGPAPQLELACRSCSSPATNKGYCIYCLERENPHIRDPHTRIATDKHCLNQAAALRMQRAEEREIPKETATTRLMAAGHPSTWPSQDGEP